MIRRSEYKVGEFLYTIPSIDVEEVPPITQRVFIHNGYINGDGYGMLLGWHEGQIVKSTGWRNFCWGGLVRRASQEEIEEFMKALMAQNVIKNY